MKARKSRGEEPTEALKGLAPFFASWMAIASYLALQPIIRTEHLVPFAFYVGLSNAYSVGQMIVAHLTHSPFPYHNVLIIPMTYGLVDSLGPFLQKYIGTGWPSALGNDVYQVAFALMCVGLAVGVYGSFVVDVIVTICDYLDIWCLTIKHPKALDNKGESKGKEGTGKKKEL